MSDKNSPKNKKNAPKTSEKSDLFDVSVKKAPQKEKKSFKIKAPRGIFAASGEKIKTQRTMRFWFTFAIFILFAITGITTALIFLLLNLIASFKEKHII